MWGSLLIVGLVALLVGTLIAVGIGVYVTMTHPDVNDPKRNRRRYVIPGMLALLVGILGLGLIALASIMLVIVGAP